MFIAAAVAMASWLAARKRNSQPFARCSTQAIRKLKSDGSVIEFQADLSGLEEITRWVLSWGGNAKVLAPPELKERVRKEALAMAGL